MKLSEILNSYTSKQKEPTNITPNSSPVAIRRSTNLQDIGSNTINTIGALLGNQQSALELYNTQQETEGSYTVTNLASDIATGSLGYGVGSFAQKSLLDLVKSKVEQEVEKTLLKNVVKEQIPLATSNITSELPSGQLAEVNPQTGEAKLNTTPLVVDQLIGTGVFGAGHTLLFTGKQLKNIDTKKVKQFGENVSSKIKNLIDELKPPKEEPKKENTNTTNNNIKEKFKNLEIKVEPIKTAITDKIKNIKDLFNKNLIYEDNGELKYKDTFSDLEPLGSFVKDMINEKDPNAIHMALANVFNKGLADKVFILGNDKESLKLFKQLNKSLRDDYAFIGETSNGEKYLFLNKNLIPSLNDFQVGSILSHEQTHLSTNIKSPISETIAYTDELINALKRAKKSKSQEDLQYAIDTYQTGIDNMLQEADKSPVLKKDIYDYIATIENMIKNKSFDEKVLLKKLNNINSKLKNKNMNEFFGNEELLIKENIKQNENYETQFGSNKINDFQIDYENIMNNKILPILNSKRIDNTRKEDMLMFLLKDALNLKKEPYVEISTKEPTQVIIKKDNLLFKINPNENIKEILLDEFKHYSEPTKTKESSPFENKILEKLQTDKNIDEIKIDETKLKNEIASKLEVYLKNKDIDNSYKQILLEHIYEEPSLYAKFEEKDGKVNLSHFYDEPIKKIISAPDPIFSEKEILKHQEFLSKLNKLSQLKKEIIQAKKDRNAELYKIKLKEFYNIKNSIIKPIKKTHKEKFNLPARVEILNSLKRKMLKTKNQKQLEIYKKRYNKILTELTKNNTKNQLNKLSIEEKIKTNTITPKTIKNSTEAKKQTNKTINKKGPSVKQEKNENKLKNNEYINMEYETTNIDISNLKQKYEPIENDFDLKIQESIDFDNAKDYLSKLGVSNFFKKMIQASGGSKPLHLVSLIHEYAHNVFPNFSEKEIVGLTANTIMTLQKEIPELLKKFEAYDNKEFYKELIKQTLLYKNHKEVNKLIQHILGSKNLKNILFGNQKYFNKFDKLNDIAKLFIDDIFNSLKETELYKEAKSFIDKAPQIVKDILIEANLLEPDKIVKTLQEVKEKQKNTIKLYSKIMEKLYDKVEKDIGPKKMEALVDSGVIQARMFFDSFEELLNKLNKIEEPTKKQIKIIEANKDFRFGPNKNRFKNKLEFLQQKKTIVNTFSKSSSDKAYENYLLKRIKYFMKEKGLNIDDLEKSKHLIEFINEAQKEVLDKNIVVIGYKPYIVKTFNKLTLVLTENQRKEFLQKGYKEIEPYLFIDKHIEEDFKSQLIMSSSENKRTGLTYKVSKKELEQIPQDLKKRLSIYNIDENNYIVSYFPSKDLFYEVYDKLEPKEVINEMFNSLIYKYTNKELRKISSYKELISSIVSSKSKEGYVELKTDEAISYLNKLFNVKNNKWFIKKEYRHLFEYKEFLPKNETLKIAYKVYKSIINRLKGNLTYKSPIAFTSNIISGILAMINLGVNPKYIPKLFIQTLKEYKEWTKYEKYIVIAFEKNGLEGVKEYLKTIKKNNIFAEIMYDGKIGSLSIDDYILFGKSNDDKIVYSMLKKIDNKLGTNNAKKILNTLKFIALDKETVIGSYLVNLYGNIDLFSRAMTYKYLKANIGKEESIKRINDIFVDFNKEPIGWISDLELSGIPFLTFVLRLQGGILKTIYRKPITTLVLFIAYEMIANDNNDNYAGKYRIDSWFLDRAIGDTLTLKLSVYNQLMQGNIDKILEHSIVPRLYEKTYNAVESGDLEKIIVSKY